MPDESEARPPRRRPRGRRRGGPPRPQQAPAQPERPAAPRADRGTTRDRPPRRSATGRDDRRPVAQGADALARSRRGRRGGRGQGPRGLDDIRPGTPCLVLLDAREGEPDRSGSVAVFEGFFDFETGDPRRPGHGIPRLRMGDERLWGFECWWRVDSERGGMTDEDREDLGSSKRLLRGLLRDSRRSMRTVR